MRLPIIKLVQSLGKYLTKPKQETTTLASGTRIHYIDFDKLKKYKLPNEIEMKKITKKTV